MAPRSTRSTSDDTEDRTPEGVASVADNQALAHSVEGETTRDDRLDVGVPMLQGSPDEPQGPEDALGKGPKRGDYSTRVADNHAESVPVAGGGEPVLDDDGNVVDYKPRFVIEDQVARVADRGDAEGLKGGVETAHLAQ